MNNTGYPSADRPWLALYPNGIADGEHRLPDCTMYEYVRRGSLDYPEGTALLCGGRTISYAMLTAGVEKAAEALLAAGVRKGDVVMLALPSVPEAVFLIYAVGSIGAVCDLLSPATAADTLAFHMEASAPKMVFYDARRRKELAGVIQKAGSVPVEVRRDERMLFPHSGGAGILSWHAFLKRGKGAAAAGQRAAAEPSPDDVAMIIHTSGSTAESKPVMLSHRNLNAFVYLHRTAQREFLPRGGRTLCLNSLFVIAGFCVTVHLILCAGLTSVLLPDVRPGDLAKMAEKTRSVILLCTAAELERTMVSGKNYDLSSVKRIYVGGEPLSPALEKKLQVYLESCGAKEALCNSYGLTEACSGFCIWPAGIYVPGGAGVPMLGVNVSVFDPETGAELRYGEEGELCVTGPVVMKGYLKRQEETAKMLRRHKDGAVWLHTGDLGKMNENGVVFVLDRVSRGMDVGGKKIYPAKIQRVLSGFDRIDSCAVTGKDGKLTAYIVPVPGISTEEWPAFVAALKGYAESHLPPEERPDDYVYLDALPRLPSGKTDLRMLAAVGEITTKMWEHAEQNREKK